ncbi:UDP-Gal or UDP-GlcNAc-dependent glycosyltransferase, putative [Trypanosoma brucei brucei TREU927]|uniref:UDP-Gal or UDP-GlcNAc-dependent glycosyltransferase, putative n=1 Tax=Trypanosoma brucei brucei (strain 927/4 GUTat10.1) TaxID=185431 RepID=Q38CR0_TRYB2|nr:UDP-Gal/UDP-GlcNAc-dependent glycosyltransferase [Trypanosoma brucei brucei TREU927]EAN77410.1 UDP-Gal or UDP-GlcNAc-dependent glycosyltransferase, putative [Trypanosoma brucei brucei TREU927]
MISRKTYLWFKFEVETLKPTNPYKMKADDDIFMRAPLYLKYLEVLPREKLNMGRAMGHVDDSIWRMRWHAVGYANTLSRDVVEEIVGYSGLCKLLFERISFRNFEKYIDYGALNEDIMVGEVIRNKLKIEGLLTVDMQDCHYAMNVQRPLDPFVEDNPNLIVLHHIANDEYRWLMLHCQALAPHNQQPPSIFQITAFWHEFTC